VHQSGLIDALLKRYSDTFKKCMNNLIDPGQKCRKIKKNLKKCRKRGVFRTGFDFSIFENSPTFPDFTINKNGEVRIFCITI